MIPVLKLVAETDPDPSKKYAIRKWAAEATAQFKNEHMVPSETTSSLDAQIELDTEGSQIWETARFWTAGISHQILEPRTHIEVCVPSSIFGISVCSRCAGYSKDCMRLILTCNYDRSLRSKEKT